MNRPNPVDFAQKLHRLRSYMDQNGYGAVILGRRDSTAWLTGGDFKVLRDTEAAFGLLLITPERVTLVAQYMDADRIFDDELMGLAIEKVSLLWYEESREARALQLAGDVRVASDLQMDGADFRLWELIWLHYPLTDHDVSIMKEGAVKCDQMIYDIALNIVPGMTERQIEAEIVSQYAKAGMIMKVVLVGSDERIAKYRHPNASNKPIENIVLLHPAACYRGIHINITRMVCFGEIPQKLQQDYDLLNLLEAQTMSMMRPGASFRSIFQERKRLLADRGMQREADFHYPGALTGYILGSAQPYLDDRTFTDRMSMDNFITVSGAKVEEVSISGEKGAELISAGHIWPTKTYIYQENAYNLPIILQR